MFQLAAVVEVSDLHVGGGGVTETKQTTGVALRSRVCVRVQGS